jgi:mono/diheme cytochrome c family protein
VNKACSNGAAAHIAAVAMAAIALTGIALMMAPSATAQQNAGAGNAGTDPAQVDLGKATFASKCSHCHGPNMVNSGTITPDLRRFPDDRERFVTTVKSGKNGKMPPWGDVLNDQEIADLWAYVSSRRTP